MKTSMLFLSNIFMQVRKLQTAASHVIQHTPVKRWKQMNDMLGSNGADVVIVFTSPDTIYWRGEIILR